MVNSNASSDDHYGPLAQTGEPTPDDEGPSWTDTPTHITHLFSDGAMHGIAVSFNRKSKTFWVTFPGTDAYPFSAVTGKGRNDKCKLWKLPLQELRKLRQEAQYEPPVERRKPRKPRVAPAADPRQTRIC